MKKIGLIVMCIVLVSACKKADVGKQALEFPLGARLVTDKSSKWISQVLAYYPAPGQWINDPGYGTPQAAQILVGPKGLNDPKVELSLGGFGGYVIFQFDHTVINIEGYDFVIKANAFKGGAGDNISAGSSEPGIVMVSFDENGNGEPDDTWYELAGTEHSASTTRINYSIIYLKPTQTDSPADIEWSDGVSGGAINKLDSHENSLWPNFIKGNPSSLVFTGTCITTRVTDNDGTIVLHPVGSGYADNYSQDYDLIIGTDKDTRNSNKFDISNAVDSNGNKVKLLGIDFIKVYTAVNQQAPILGEISTEICGAISLTVK